MSFRSPWDRIAEAIPQAGAAIAQFFQQQAAMQLDEKRRTEQRFFDTKNTLNREIATALSQRGLSDADRARLEEEMRLINRAESMEELEQLMAGQAGSTATTKGPGTRRVPAGQGAAGGNRVALGAPSITAEVKRAPGSTALAAGASARAAEAVEAEEDTESQYNFIRQLAAQADVPQAERVRLARNFIRGMNVDALTDTQKSTLMSIAQFEDENALRTAAAQAAGAEQAVERGEVALEQDKLTLQIARETADAVVSERKASARSAEAGATLAEETLDANIAVANLRPEQVRQQMQESATRLQADMKVTDVRLQQIRQQIEQSDVMFPREVAAQDAKAIETALFLGTDSHMTPDQKQMLAAYMGFESPNAEGYQSQLASLQDARVEAVIGQARAQALAGEQAAANLGMTEAQTARTWQSYRREAYDFKRARTLDPIRDANEFQTTLAQAVWSGDVAVVDTYLNLMSEDGPQADALREMGFTRDGLKALRNTAVAERNRIRQDNEARSDILQAQLETLNRSNEIEKLGVLSTVSEYYQTPEQVYNDPALKELRYTPREVDQIAARVRYRNVITEQGEAATRLNDLTQVAPAPGGEDAWRASFVGLATQAGHDKATAEAMADGFLAAFRNDRDAFALEMERKRLQNNQLRLQAQALENPPEADSPLGMSVSEWYRGTEELIQAGTRRQANEGCLPPSSFGEMIVSGMINMPQGIESVDAAVEQYSNRFYNPDQPVCTNLNNDLSFLEGQISTALGYAPFLEEIGNSGAVNAPSGGATASPSNTGAAGGVSTDQIVSQARSLVSGEPTPEAEEQFRELKLNFLMQGNSEAQWNELVFGE